MKRVKRNEKRGSVDPRFAQRMPSSSLASLISVPSSLTRNVSLLPLASDQDKQEEAGVCQGMRHALNHSQRED